MINPRKQANNKKKTTNQKATQDQLCYCTVSWMLSEADLQGGRALGLHTQSRCCERLGRMPAGLISPPIPSPRVISLCSADLQLSEPTLPVLSNLRLCRQVLVAFLKQHLLSKHKYVYCGNFVLALLPSLFARCFSFYTHRRHRAMF